MKVSEAGAAGERQEAGGGQHPDLSGSVEESLIFVLKAVGAIIGLVGF